MCRVAVGGLTMTQIDPAVLAELPPDVVAELVAGLPPSHEPFAKQGNLSPSASESEGGSDADADGEGTVAGRQPKIVARGPEVKVRRPLNALHLDAPNFEIDVGSLRF